jgi:hypothetical protein
MSCEYEIDEEKHVESVSEVDDGNVLFYQRQRTFDGKSRGLYFH